MLSMTLRTDKPEAELGIYEGSEQLAYLRWEAHRALAETIHQKIEEVLGQAKKSLQDVQGIVVFQGPGSFTGLRIGLTVANALADSYKLPIIASQGDDWLTAGLDRINSGESDTLALPEYGAPVHITTPKK